MSTEIYKALGKIQSQILVIYSNNDDSKYLTFDKDLGKPTYKYTNFSLLNDINPLKQDIIFDNNFGIDSTLNNILNIGQNNANTINIGSSGNTSTINIGTNNNFTTINIGDANDIVNIAGEFNVIKTNNIEVFNKQITLNKDSVGSGTARGVGINIRDNNNDTQGYIKINNTGKGILFKAPESDFEANLIINSNSNILTDTNIQNFKFANDHTFIITDDIGSTTNTKFLQIKNNDIILNPINDVIISKDIYYDNDKEINKKTIKITSYNGIYQDIVKINLTLNSSYFIKFIILGKSQNINSASFNGSIKYNFINISNEIIILDYINLESCIDDEIYDVNISCIIYNNELKIQIKGVDNKIINWTGIFKIIKI